jgi:hypothetical protein
MGASGRTGAEPIGRSIARIVAVLFLGITGLVGIYNAFDEWANPYSPFQRIVYAGVVVYGVLGLLAAYGVIRRRSWSRHLVMGWALAITFVSGTAAIAYGGPDVTPVAGVAAGAGGALIGAFVVWAARAA